MLCIKSCIPINPTRPSRLSATTRKSEYDIFKPPLCIDRQEISDHPRKLEKGSIITAANKFNDFCVTGPEWRALMSGCAFSISRKHSAESCARTAEFDSEKSVTRDSPRASATL